MKAWQGASRPGSGGVRSLEGVEVLSPGSRNVGGAWRPGAGRGRGRGGTRADPRADRRSCCGRADRVQRAGLEGRAGGCEHGPGVAPHPHRCCPIPQAGPAGLPQAGRAAAAAMRRQPAGRRPPPLPILGNREKRVSGESPVRARSSEELAVVCPTVYSLLNLPLRGDPSLSLEPVLY